MDSNAELEKVSVKKQCLLRRGVSMSVSFWEIGKSYFIRTISYHYTGKLVQLSDKELVLESAAWIADDGRFTNCIRDGMLEEVEPYIGTVVLINREAVVDACFWMHPLPTKQK